MTRSGHSVHLKRSHVELLDQLATMKGVSRSEIIAAALAAYLSSGVAERWEVVTTPRFDKFAHQLEQLERGQTLLIETLALFIRDYLAGTAPVLGPHQEEDRARGRARFGQFIEQLACHLQRDGSFVRELEQELSPGESRFPPLDEEHSLATTSPDGIYEQ